MKTTAVFVALAVATSAHFKFPSLIVNGERLSFSGAYKTMDPGIMIDSYSKPVSKSHFGICSSITHGYFPKITSYTYPGPAV